MLGVCVKPKCQASLFDISINVFVTRGFNLKLYIMPEYRITPKSCKTGFPLNNNNTEYEKVKEEK